MKPSKELVSKKYSYDGSRIVYAVDSGRYGRYKAGSPAGSVGNSGDRVVQFDKKYYPEHHIVWLLCHGSWPARPIRHINGDLLDNRVENLSMDSMARGKREDELGVDRLNEVLSYNAVTGEFLWKISPRNRTLPGDKAGHMNDQGYMLCTIDQKKIRLHRAAWAMHYGEIPSGHLDHINGIRSDNRISNLRLATQSQNMQNTATRKDNKHRVKGVHKRKDNGRFSAHIAVDGKSRYLGCFGSLEEAQNARLQAEIDLHPYRAVGR